MNPTKELKVIFITVLTSRTLFTKWPSSLYSLSSLSSRPSRPCSPTTPWQTTTPWSGMLTQGFTPHRRSWAKSCPAYRIQPTSASSTAGMSYSVEKRGKAVQLILLRPGKRLPDEMTRWLEADTRPVIYMSMGSIYQVPETVLNICEQVRSNYH